MMNVFISYSGLKGHIEYIEQEEIHLHEIEKQMRLFKCMNETEFYRYCDQYRQIMQTIDALSRSFQNKIQFIEDTIDEFHHLNKKNQSILDEVETATMQMH